MRSFIIAVLLMSMGTIHLKGAELWVSPQGADTYPGTKSQPVATLDAALRKVREWRRLNDERVAKGVNIYMQGGRYRLKQPIFIRPEDSGTATSPTIISAAPDEQPIISGGIPLKKNWQKVTDDNARLAAVARGKVWVIDAPKMGDEVVDFRQLWVNDIKAVRAKSTLGDSMDRILSWNHKDETCWIPKSTNFQWQSGMEFFIHQWWAVATLRIKEANVVADSVQLSFLQPESKLQSEHPWPAPWLSKETGNSAFYLTNSIHFLDEPGEWYLDKQRAKLYYWPRDGENLSTAEVLVPYLETLLRVAGTIDQPVQHIHFKGITWQHSTWLRPSKRGHVALQAGMYFLDAYKLEVPGTSDKKGLENQAWIGRPDAAATLSYTQHTSFEDCKFEHLASTGLDYHRGVQHNSIKGNLFRDIGGSAILLGVFSDEAFETHLPYNPTDVRELTSDNRIENNLITNVTNEDWGCVGIGAGYVRNTIIQHNEISEVSYTGISLGWGWTPTVSAMANNKVSANKIHHYAKHMNDVAGIYTLSAQPGSVIEENYIDSIYTAPYAHLPEHWFYLYTDEGSAYFTVKNNWCPQEKFLQNANGPGNTWKHNGPMVSESVKQQAGLQEAYKYLLSR
ncbi:right-handed parallel beta-helix repeat-containing protein [Olivibacter sp. SDN3]|uniref:right-handed parallel beta-helix repeat-containing protein n=1 Tax=Olivibacter sp. SDN3 TaxID=2764720 RepID=UPI0016512469|nr:right-handed parallel beta-helix repeat-containing protein [Olivibacter sp. SDN3]QNL52263.1 right-handed parallel beta-helix repeat-containing protein [Olivibacter sp. SDN3]